MKFTELGKDLQEFLSKKTAIDKANTEEIAKLNERFKGTFLDARLAERKASHDTALNAIRSGIKADIEAIRAEKVKLAEAAATKAPSQETMMLLQALNMRESVPKSEIISIFEAIQGNHHALNVLRDIAEDKGYAFDVESIEQVRQRINKACDLAERAVDGKLDALTLAALGDREYAISLYDEAERMRNATLMIQLDAQIKSGASLWDSMTAGLDDGYTTTPAITRVLTPGEKEIVKRMFDGVPADRLKEKVNDKAAESPEMRELIALSDFSSLLTPDGAA